MCVVLFFFNEPATTEIYTLPLHDALPIYKARPLPSTSAAALIDPSPIKARRLNRLSQLPVTPTRTTPSSMRSEEHTSELQSRQYLVCRLLLEKKKKD